MSLSPMRPIPCGHRWEASRVECETLPVLHVCDEPRESHTEHAVVIDAGLGLTNAVVPVHVCACGAVAVGPAVPQHGHALGRTPWDGPRQSGGPWS